VARERRHLRLSTVLWLLLAIAAIAAVAANAGELIRIARTLKSARPQYLALAVCVQVVFGLNLARFYVTTFHAAGLRAQTWRFLFITSASYFINLVSNTTGLGGLAIYLAEGRRTNDPASRVSAAYMVVYVLGHLAFFIVLTTALVLLYLRGSLTTAEAVSAAVVGAIAAVIGLMLAAGLRNRASLRSAFLLGVWPLNFFARAIVHRDLVARVSVVDTADGLYDAVAEMRRRPARFLIPFVHALGVELLSALLLYLVARALNVDIGPEIALIGYAVSLLSSLVVIIPGGIGIAEASLSLFLISMGVPSSQAIAVALGFRVFDFWLPVVNGAFSVAALRQSRNELAA